MSDLIFLHFRHDTNCTARVDKHFEGYCSLQLVTRGAVELFLDDARFELETDSQNGAWLWPCFPGPHIRFHASRAQSSWEHRYVAFSGERVSDWKHAGLWLESPQISPRGEDIADDFDRLLGLVERGGSWASRRAAHALEAILLELAEARAASGKEEPWLVQSREWLRTQPDFAPDYSELSRELNMGLSTLRRKFRAATGSSLHGARLHYRLESARHLLGETDLPIKQIADQLGFSDVFAFSRQFKQRTGASPGLFRKSRQV